jgi:hypothetical protein
MRKKGYCVVVKFLKDGRIKESILPTEENVKAWARCRQNRRGTNGRK